MVASAAEVTGIRGVQEVANTPCLASGGIVTPNRKIALLLGVRRILGGVYRRKGVVERFPAVPCSRKCNDLSDNVEAWMAIYLCYKPHTRIVWPMIQLNLVLYSLQVPKTPKHALLIRHSFRAQRPILCNSKPKNDIKKGPGPTPGQSPRARAAHRRRGQIRGSADFDVSGSIRFRVLIGP